MLRFLCPLLLLLIFPAATMAQGLDLTAGGVGLGLGDVPRVTGIRLNYRDRHLERVNGLNVTLWYPYHPAGGTVNGVAVGLPLTGARRVHGLTLGLAGASADERLTGIMVGGIGLGSGEDITGLGLAAAVIGSGRDITGLMVGGFGVGSGRNLSGVMAASFGVGAGGNLTGLFAGGFGVGAGGDVQGIVLGGLGVGTGGNLTGIALGGLGVGTGGNLTGIALGGLGVGTGGNLTGIALGGLGVGASRVEGALVAGVAAGAGEMTGLALAPGYFNLGRDGLFRGLAVSAFNHIRGEQRGLTIGLFNYARRLYGLQIGLLNYAGNNPKGLRLLPLVNLHFD
ncbi:MAG: hypothetical protein KatS3mg043_0489 [Rhodothermaceae bacterium]|nr:MAG: hypothetical protein KatS3mg043_0489 [Rhodothermaceae bacterium]